METVKALTFEREYRYFHFFKTMATMASSVA